MANGGSVIFKFEGDTSNLDEATKNTKSALGTLAKSFTIGSIASQAVSKGIALISDNLDGAISRFDTMTNFPKVMKTLGYETEDAQKAVETLSDGLLGLPTALDDSITYVQRFTAKNNDLDKSSKIFLAINDAILAGGANAQTQATAIEQFTQSFSKGKPDLIEWRTLLTAMPGQLKQIAQSMGYASADDLYNAFKENKISMDDFTDAIIRLDEEGTDGIESFKVQAKNATGGISTAMTNLKTRTIRAITDVISKINESLKDVGGISGVIEKLGKGIVNVINILGKGITTLIKFKKEVIAIGALIMAWKIGKTILSMVQAFQKAQVALALYKLQTNGATLAQGLLNGQLTLGEIAVGLLTKKMTLAEIATALWSKAQMILNGLLNANIIGAVVVGVLALTAGITALVKVIQNNTKEERENAKAMQEYIDKSNEELEAIRKNKEEREKSLTGIQSQYDYTQKLANELKTLADENGNVADKDKARAEFILGELNNALGTEYKMTGDVINQYQNLVGTIDELIQKKRTELMLQVYEEDYKNALKQRMELTKEGAEVYKAYTQAYTDFMTKGSVASEKAMAKASQAVDNYEKKVKESSQILATYEEAYVASLDGDFDKVEQILQNGSDNYETFSNEITTTARKQGGDFVKAIGDGAQSKKPYSEKIIIGIARTLGVDIQEELSPSVFTNTGANILTGISNGMLGGIPGLMSVARTVAGKALSAIKSALGIHSPSKVFRDQVGKNMALGIGVGFDKEIEDVQANMKNAIKDISMGDLFELSPTLNNTMSTSPIINVAVVNNMETDMMGNLINNIKTYSNGSKNDFNYGMA